MSIFIVCFTPFVSNAAFYLIRLVTQEMILYAQSMNKKSVGEYMQFTGDDLWLRAS